MNCRFYHYGQLSANQQSSKKRPWHLSFRFRSGAVIAGATSELPLTVALNHIQQIYSNFIDMSKVTNRQAINNDIKHSIALLLHPDPTLQQQAERNTNIRLLNISSSLIHRQIQILAWRFKTSLPIVKPVEYTLTHNSPSPSKNTNLPTSPLSSHMPNKSFQRQSTNSSTAQMYSPRQQQSVCEIRIQIEDIKCRLSDIGLLPFSQILYLLKEMMIGYDVLIDKFGTFSPSENMVVVSQTSQWKVWINEDFFKNSKDQQKTAEIGIREFIYCLILLAQKHCACTSQSKLFFNDIKQYTYGNNCGFVKMLQKMKEFSVANKIFQVNKVTFPSEQASKISKQQSINLVTNSQNTPKNNDSFNSSKPQSKLRMEKKFSYQQMASNFNYGCRSPTYAANNNSFNFPEHQHKKTQQQFLPQQPMTMTPNHFPLQHSRSHKVINHSAFFYNPVQSNQIPFFQANKRPVNVNEPIQINGSYQLNRNYDCQKKKMGYSYMPNSVQKKFQSGFRSPEIRSKPQSPQARPLQSKNTSFVHHFTKSRQQLKNLVSKKTEQSTNVLKVPNQSKPKQRKYSEQVFKAKSVDALAKVAKRIYGSNIYEQDPQIKQNGVNVIKINANSKNLKLSPTKKDSNNLEITNKKQYSSGLKGADSGTPNNSSNSTQELQNSRERVVNKQSKYEHLKANDLDKGRIRNNQSSCYGMGGYTEEQKRQKNMVVSCSFRNRDDGNSSKSESKEKKQRAAGNNWTKKISGLFSDDASIKHLKGSVKFKTNEEERFQKEYLKDVKLQMLQKFGRPVRHSIVDEDQDFSPCTKNPYKSMQLIEQAIDEGKSYVEKDEELEQQVSVVRGRHQTVQVYNYKGQDQKQVNIQHKECVSYQCSEKDSEEQFNFESQAYVINKK